MPVLFLEFALNLVDKIICEIDTGLRTVFAPQQATRALPPAATADAGVPNPESARLMRVNHTGEVCAQALYQGQALVARDASTRTLLTRAADEERDHLAWCAARIESLGSRPSILNPAFYAGSFALGVASGLLGDRWSMGFLVETERQVEAHLAGHLDAMPPEDLISRRIIAAMQADEVRHAEVGLAHGAESLPPAVSGLMRLAAGVMTRTSYWI